MCLVSTNIGHDVAAAGESNTSTKPVQSGPTYSFASRWWSQDQTLSLKNWQQPTEGLTRWRLPWPTVDVFLSRWSASCHVSIPIMAIDLTKDTELRPKQLLWFPVTNLHKIWDWLQKITIFCKLYFNVIRNGILWQPKWVHSTGSIKGEYKCYKYIVHSCITNPCKLSAHVFCLCDHTSTKHILGTLWVDVSVCHVKWLGLVHTFDSLNNVASMLK